MKDSNEHHVSNTVNYTIMWTCLCARQRGKGAREEQTQDKTDRQTNRRTGSGGDGVVLGLNRHKQE